MSNKNKRVSPYLYQENEDKWNAICAQYATETQAFNELVSSRADCGCNGSGIVGSFRSEFIYCRCRTGLDAEMNMIAKQLQILADDLVTLASDAPGREGKQFLFDQLKAEYDGLEREWTKLQTDRD